MAGLLAPMEVIDAAALGMNAVAINSAKDSNTIKCYGYNQLTLEIKYTRSAGTAVTFYVNQVDEDGSEFYRMYEVEGTVASGVQPIDTYRKRYDRTTSVSENWVVNIPIQAYAFKIESMTATSGDANDKVVVRARLGRL